MRLQARRKLFLLLSAAVFVISCDVTSFLASPAFPTTAPGAVNTIIAQTAAAAATQTALRMPAVGPVSVSTIVAQTAAVAATQTEALIPDTLTPSFTPFPSQTPSITPTSTPTFIFKLKTPTRPPPTKTPVPTKKSSSGAGGGGHGSGGGSSSVSWSCQLTGQSPVNGVHFAASSPFTTNWTVKNTSSLTWIHTSIDIVNVGGTNLASSSFFDTFADVAVGGSETVSVNMTAPAGSGTYTSNWSLRVGKTFFCPLSISITVP